MNKIMNKVLLLILVSLVTVHGDIIACSTLKNGNWTDPHMWMTGIVPSVNDFAVIENCNICINRIDNITISGILVNSGSIPTKLTVAGNLTILGLTENYGNIHIDKSSTINILAYLRNVGYIVSKGNLSIYSHYENPGQISLSNFSMLFINTKVTTLIGNIELSNSSIYHAGTEPLVLGYNNNLNIDGNCTIHGNIISNGSIGIGPSSTFNIDSLIQRESKLSIYSTSLLSANKLDINSSLGVYLDHHINYNKTINSTFIIGKKSFNCFFRNVKDNALKNDEYQNNDKHNIGIYMTNTSVYMTIRPVNSSEWDIVLIIVQVLVWIGIGIGVIMLIKKMLSNNDNLDLNLDLEIPPCMIIILRIIFGIILSLGCVLIYYTFIPNWANVCSKTVFNGSVIAMHTFQSLAVYLAAIGLLFCLSLLFKNKFDTQFWTIAIISFISVTTIGLILIISGLGFRSETCIGYKYLFEIIGAFLLVPFAIGMILCGPGR